VDTTIDLIIAAAKEVVRVAPRSDSREGSAQIPLALIDDLRQVLLQLK
jgi:hypothetical protein